MTARDYLSALVLLAIDADIHGALVGGVVGALAVIIGVAGTELAVRARERREAIDAASDRLALLLPRVLYPISVEWTGERPDTSWTSEWQTQVETVRTSLRTILRKSRCATAVSCAPQRWRRPRRSR